MTTFTRVALTIIVLVIFSSCGVIKTQYASWEYDKRGNDTRNPDFHDDLYLYELADRFGLMAHFAQVAYRDDLVEKSKDFSKSTGELISVEITKDRLDSACDYLAPSIPLPKYGMPYLQSSGSKGLIGAWSRWRGSDKYKSEPCYNDEGLFYETYVYTEKGKITQAVIAYRGTENDGEQFWHDWRSNVASFFGFEPRQYEIAAEKLPAIIKALKLENANIAIYTTGHSLGGGLAQQAGYLSKDIKEVFTFNTSPVTNWTNLALDGKVKNAYPIFHRIYNGGEVLGGIRGISTVLTKARYGRHDIGIQVKPKKLIAGHSMTLLSCHFACLIENQNKVAKFSYSHNYIRKKLMSDGGICKGYVDFDKCELSAKDN